MRKFGFFAVIMTLVLVACQPSNIELPTVVQFPTVTNTVEPTAIPTETLTPVPTNTTEPSLTPTDTAQPTNTTVPTRTTVPTETIDPTIASRGTATAIVQEAPVFSTFTPLPPGAIAVVSRPTSTGTPEVVADVVITTAQFQEEVNRLIIDIPTISRAEVSLVPDGVRYDLTADNNGVFITGNITVPFSFSGGSINNIVTIGGGVTIELPELEAEAEENEEEFEIPEAFLTNVSEMVLITQETFNFILNQRLGEGNHDLENIVIIDGNMLISLVVPLPSQ